MSGKLVKPLKNVKNEVCGCILLLERSSPTFFLIFLLYVEGHMALDNFRWTDPIRKKLGRREKTSSC